MDEDELYNDAASNTKEEERGGGGHVSFDDDGEPLNREVKRAAKAAYRAIGGIRP